MLRNIPEGNSPVIDERMHNFLDPIGLMFSVSFTTVMLKRLLYLFKIHTRIEKIRGDEDEGRVENKE